MHVRTRSHAGLAATGVAVAGIAAMAATPLAPAPQTQSATRDVRLSADDVPLGGLLTSFLGNQVVYCAAICPPLVNTGVTAAATTLRTPVTFLAAVQSGDLLKAIGTTAASVTGPTNAALAAASDADTTVAVPKASNTFEVGVIGLLNLVPATAGGLPAVGAALEAFREQTFEALNLPIPVTGPTVMPNGVVQVAALGAIRVGEAVVFPAFNDVLQAAVGVPDAAAQELAATGDPVRAAAAGVNSAAGSVNAAVNVVAKSVVTAASDIRNAATQSSSRRAVVQSVKPSTARTSVLPFANPARRSTSTAKHAAKPETNSSHPLRNVASKVSQAARSIAKDASEGPRHAKSNKHAS